MRPQNPPPPLASTPITYHPSLFTHHLRHSSSQLSDYPYESGKTAKAGTCRESECEDVPGTGLFSFEDVPANDPNAMMAALSSQPVSIAIQANQPGFRFYKDGIFNGPCGTNLDHGVLAVGYGSIKTRQTSEAGTTPHPFRPVKTGDYWLVKNSWGPTWGVDGYIKLGRTGKNGPGTCGILMQASYPDVKKHGGEEAAVVEAIDGAKKTSLS